MKLKKWLVTDSGTILTSVVMTIIVLIESISTPWAPYFIFYAILAIVIPLWLKTYRFGSLGDTFKAHWKLILGIFVLAAFLDEGIATWLYQRILDSLGVGANPFYSLNVALEALAERAAHKFNISNDMAMMTYALFLIVWAPIGEELFYRGYVQGVLRKTHGFRFAAIVSAAFFGIRHATHLFFLWPNMPWIAALSWVVSAFVFGLLMSYLYEKTDSLYPLILVHAGVNIVELIFM